MVRFGIVQDLRPVRVLAVGDFMLDTYTRGRIRRISPEAPVPVLEVDSTDSRPGGAGNVVLNFLALGASVTAVGRIGDDEAGEELRVHLMSSGADVEGLCVDGSIPTPQKNRLLAGQQILRVDRERIVTLSAEMEEAFLKTVREALPCTDLIALSDYGKGTLSRSLLRRLIEAARAAEVPVLVDPKGDDFSRYQGATLIKPNLAEAYAAAKLSSASLEEVASVLRAYSDYILITRSEAGMSLFDARGTRTDFPVRARDVRDVTGAGDTVLAVLGTAWASGIPLAEAVALANIAAALSIERLGCAQVTPQELTERLRELAQPSSKERLTHLQQL